VADSADIVESVPLAIVVENLAPFTHGMASIGPDDAAARAQAAFSLALEMVGIGAAIENMWLAAEALGLCGCFLADAAIAEETIRAATQATGPILGLLALGHSAEKPPAPTMPHLVPEVPHRHVQVSFAPAAAH
jgi:nitroreductase